MEKENKEVTEKEAKRLFEDYQKEVEKEITDAFSVIATYLVKCHKHIGRHIELMSKINKEVVKNGK